MKTKLLYACILATVLVFAGCKKETPKSPADKVKITEATAADGLKAVLWANQSELAVGYNKVYLSLSDATGEIKGQPVTISPIMNMGMMEHGCPVEQPVYDEETGLYAGAIAFTMPTSDMESWRLTVEVNNRNVSLDLTVAQAAQNTKPLGTFIGTDSLSYVLTLIEPSSPKTGINDLVILVNRSETMFSYPAVNDFTIEFYPEMTSMGHSSPNNENPMAVGNGRYKGKVNYTMTGDWRLFFTIKRNGETIVSETYLDILF